MVRQAQLVYQLLRPLPGLSSRQTTVHSEDAKVLVDSQILEQIGLLRDDPQVAFDPGGLGHDVMSEDGDLSRRWAKLGGDLTHEGGLARPIWPQDAEDLTRLGAQRDVAVGPRAVLITLVEVPHHDGRAAKRFKGNSHRRAQSSYL